MSKKNRTTLRNYFSSGQMPTEEHFHHLIDSSLNLIEEGFDRDKDTGIKVSTLGREDELMSFYRYENMNQPQWSLKLGTDDPSALHWKAFKAPPQHHGHTPSGQHSEDRLNTPGLKRCEPGEYALTISADGAVGIGVDKPEAELDVNGVVQMHGRRGAYYVADIKADGEWHDITDWLDGSYAFEVSAGVGIPREQTGSEGGYWANLHATAVTTKRKRWNIFKRFFFKRFHLRSRRGLSISRDHFKWDKRLCLGWTQKTEGLNNRHKWAPCKLQIRSAHNYQQSNLRIHIYLTSLWFDPQMEQLNAMTFQDQVQDDDG